MAFIDCYEQLIFLTKTKKIMEKLIRILKNKQYQFVMIVIISVLLMIAASCSQKKEIEPFAAPTKPKQCFNIEDAKDVVWHPIFSGYDFPTLKSNGDYYETGSFVGQWTFPNNCDCVVVKNQNIHANNFYFKIKRLSPDTFEVYTARFGITLFYK